MRGRRRGIGCTFRRLFAVPRKPVLLSLGITILRDACLSKVHGTGSVPEFLGAKERLSRKAVASESSTEIARRVADPDVSKYDDANDPRKE